MHVYFQSIFRIQNFQHSELSIFEYMCIFSQISYSESAHAAIRRACVVIFRLRHRTKLDKPATSQSTQPSSRIGADMQRRRPFLGPLCSG